MWIAYLQKGARGAIWAWFLTFFCKGSAEYPVLLHSMSPSACPVGLFASKLTLYMNTTIITECLRDKQHTTKAMSGTYRGLWRLRKDHHLIFNRFLSLFRSSLFYITPMLGISIAFCQFIGDHALCCPSPPSLGLPHNECENWNKSERLNTTTNLRRTIFQLMHKAQLHAPTSLIYKFYSNWTTDCVHLPSTVY